MSPLREVVDLKTSEIDNLRIRAAHKKLLEDYIIPGCFLVPEANKRATTHFDCINNDILSMLREIKQSDVADVTLEPFSNVFGYKCSDLI